MGRTFCGSEVTPHSLAMYGTALLGKELAKVLLRTAIMDEKMMTAFLFCVHVSLSQQKHQNNHHSRSSNYTGSRGRSARTPRTSALFPTNLSSCGHRQQCFCLLLPHNPLLCRPARRSGWSDSMRAAVGSRFLHGQLEFSSDPSAIRCAMYSRLFWGRLAGTESCRLLDSTIVGIETEHDGVGGSLV